LALLSACALFAQTPPPGVPAAAPGAERASAPESREYEARAAASRKPGLVGHLPGQGLDAASVRYFPSTADYEAWIAEGAGAQAKDAAHIDPSYDMEVARARYADAGRTGTLTLLKHPTPELAEDYYDRLAIPAVAGGAAVYARRTGPLVAVLEGDFAPRQADGLLASVKFGYAVRWMDEDKGGGNVVWGVPTSILGAVVGSLVFSALAGVCAILIGVALGAGRFALRGFRERRLPRPVEDDPGFTRLDLR
jgi:hypothetical protein